MNDLNKVELENKKDDLKDRNIVVRAKNVVIKNFNNIKIIKKITLKIRENLKTMNNFLNFLVVKIIKNIEKSMSVAVLIFGNFYIW